MLPLKFTPQYFERVWGGRALENCLRRALPRERKIGEAWEVSDRPGVCVSAVSEGEFAGKTLREILAARGNEILGPGGAGTPFPLIVKWLDCAASASIQVHPTAETAARFGEEGKTEAWYFFRSAEGAEFIAGLRAGTTAAALRGAIAAGTAENFVLRHKAVAGTAVLIRSGTVHTAGAGNIILEIQQSSDSTFRLYDWHRRDSAGKLRELHVEKALASIDFEMNFALAETLASAEKTVPLPRESGNASAESAPREETSEKIAGTPLCACEHFAMTRFGLGEGEFFDVPAREQPRLVTALTGTLEIAESACCGAQPTALAASETALLPFCGAFRIRSRGGNASFILTENFYSPHIA